MSVRVISAVWDSFPGAGGSELLVMLALADWSDDEGRCWPSMDAIAHKARLSRSQAQRIAHRLIRDEFLQVTGNDAGGAPGMTRRYQINLRALTGRTDATPTGRTHATGSADATGRTDARDGSHPCDETGRTGATQTVSEPSVNRQVKARTSKPHMSVDWVADLASRDVDRDVAESWLKVRKTKRAEITSIAIDGIQREATKAGISLNAALRECCERGWVAFKAEWLNRAGGVAESTYTPAQVAVFETYNSVLGAKDWPAASMEPFSPERAAAISQFLTFNDKPDWIRRYFDYLAENLQARPGYGFDWTLRRDIYLRAREANFSFGGANGQ